MNMAKTAVSHSGYEARGPAQARGPGQGPTSPMPRAGSASMAAIYSVRNGRGRFTVHGLVAISDIYNADRPSAPHSWTVAAAAVRGRKGKGERRATCRIKYGLRWGAGDKQM